MLGKRQFSISYLLLETFWVAVALGSFRAIAVLASEYRGQGIESLLMFVGIVALGAAIGGLFGQMTWGVIITFLLALILGLLLPAVMVA